MKFSKKFKSDIVAWCKNLRWEFYLAEYTMHFSWIEEDEDGKQDVLADITPDFRYLEFTLGIRPRLYDYYQHGKLDQVKRCLVHEFSHMLIDPVYRHAKDRFGTEGWEAFNEIRERQCHRTSIVIHTHLNKRVWELPTKKKSTKKRVPLHSKKDVKKKKHGTH